VIEVLRYVVVVLSLMAGIRVLRNPLRVWPSTAAGLLYFAGAAGSLLTRSWWPLLAGWAGSLVLQGICTAMIAKGVFNAQINIERARRGLPPLRGSDAE
jgi:hypothetical protein